ncbi:MAG TPA: hypothetical protein VM598_02130 [Bdellovibrionota bacterium]|nr:hypothetical protein [Bdellovibrionota bacterium]
MGDAVLPLADDTSAALFSNPAGLGRPKSTQAQPMNLSFYGNSNYFGTLDSRVYKVTSLSSYAQTLIDHPGQPYGVGAAFLPSFGVEGFAAGLLVQSQLLATGDLSGNIRNRSSYEIIPTAGFGFRTAGGILRMGYSFQWVNRAAGDVLLPAGADLGYNQGLSQGSAMSHNAGMQITLPYAYLPSAAIVARNIFGAHYSSWTLLNLSNASPGTPPDEPMSLDAALSLSPRISGSSTMNWVFELKDFTNISGVSLIGRVAVGLEVGLANAFYLRGGWGSGYPSFGFGIRRKQSEIGFSYMSEEIGQRYHHERDVKYLVHFLVRAF